jgi:hypothetical protein
MEQDEFDLDPQLTLIHIPRSSITRAKETKAIFLTSKDLIVCQNAHIEPEICFLILNEN